jgi:voltage-gated potassium channel
MTRIERFERHTQWPLAAVALSFLGLYTVLVLAEPRGVGEGVIRGAMYATYLVFVVDYAVRLYLADPRGKWFVRHLLDLAIIVLPFLRPLRLLSLAVVIEVLGRAVGSTFRGRVVVFTFGGVVAVVYAASLSILEIERYEVGSKIHSLGDAVWWAMTTVMTVGYGDVTPVSGEGRVIAVALMMAGVSLLGVVTATLASWIVERVAEEDTANQVATAAHIEELREEIRKLAGSITPDADPAYGEGNRGHRTGAQRGGT